MEREGDGDNKFRHLAPDCKTRGRTRIWLQNSVSKSTVPVFFPSVP